MIGAREVGESWTARSIVGPVRAVIDFARAKPLGMAAGVVLLVVTIIAALGPIVAPYDPNQHHAIDSLLEPSGTYPLGTDEFGRDVFSRVVYGGRVSIYIGFASSVLAVAVALTIGMTSAYFRGFTDYGVQRVVDMLQSIPPVVLLIALLAAFKPSLTSIMLVLGVFSGITMSRVVRGATLALTVQPWVEVARSIGCSPLRIMLRHLLPNVLPTMIVLATINFGTAIIAEASLGFLGYGVPPPHPSWGGMMNAEGRQFMVQAPWLFAAPTIALGVTVFSINMLGDALRDRLDPRLRGTG